MQELRRPHVQPGDEGAAARRHQDRAVRLTFYLSPTPLPKPRSRLELEGGLFTASTIPPAARREINYEWVLTAYSLPICDGFLSVPTLAQVQHRLRAVRGVHWRARALRHFCLRLQGRRRCLPPLVSAHTLLFQRWRAAVYIVCAYRKIYAPLRLV